MTEHAETLTVERKELVAVGASVGAGCHPCVHYHPKGGAKAGLEGDHEGDHEPIDRLDHTTPTREDRPTATKATRSEHRG